MGCGSSVQKGDINDHIIPTIVVPGPLESVQHSKDASSRNSSVSDNPSISAKKTITQFQKSMSFAKIIGTNSSHSITSPTAASPKDTTIIMSAGAGKNPEDQETLVSLFGDLYRLKLSNGSLEQVGPDAKQKISLITPMDEEPELSLNNFEKKKSIKLSEEPEELSDVESRTTNRGPSPVPSIDVTKPENIHQVDNWTSLQSIKYAPQIHSEKGSLMSSQKASLYQDSPNNSRSGSKSLSRTGSQAQANAVMAAIEAAAFRRSTLTKDNTFHGQTANSLEAPTYTLKKATTVHQTRNIATQRTKRREELEAEFKKWTDDKDDVDDNNENGSHGFQPISEDKENQSNGSIHLLKVGEIVQVKQTI